MNFFSLENPEKPTEKPEVVEYTEFGSKNRPGGRRQLNFTNKIILHYHVWESVVMSTCSKTTCQSFPNVHSNETYSTGRNARSKISLNQMLGIRLLL